jgi:septal ring factor EnvC (AmiA/AmiB activator)
LCIIGLLVTAFAQGQKGSDATFKVDQEIKQQTGVLDSIKYELKKGRQKLQDLESQEGSVQSKIEQVEKNIATSKRYLQLLTNKIDTVAAKAARLHDTLIFTEKSLTDSKLLMKQRIRQAYMSGKPNLILILAHSASPADFDNKAKYMQRLNAYDKELINDINRTREHIATRKGALLEEHKELSALIDTKKLEQSHLVMAEEQHKEMLSKVQAQKKAYEVMVTELERSQQELNKIIKLLETKRKKLKQQQDERKSVLSFEKRKGKLTWPVSGTVVAKFGKMVHPVYQTVTMNNGVDIQTNGSETVQCVANGTVIHTGTMRGLGKLVIVDHSGGYITIYAHLNEIAVKMDQVVESGTSLGRIGSTNKNLHFEIRKSTTSLDPADWLE